MVSRKEVVQRIEPRYKRKLLKAKTMRDIKFRGKKPKGEWVYGDLLRNRGETFIAPDGIANPLATAEDFRVEPAIVGQFTGLHDKNGRDIYEGDIFEVISSDGKPIRHVVRYSDYYGGYIQARGIDECGLLNQRYISECGKYVIGNIFDNPELLKTE